MNIRTILFDFGGVILKLPDLRWAQRWQKLFGVKGNREAAEMLANPNESQLVKDVCLGKISEDEVWKAVSERWPVKPTTVRRIRKRLFSKRNLNTKVVDFMAQAHGKYQTAILSNAGDRTRQIIENHFNLSQYLDEIIISAEEGLIKPDPRIYHLTMDRLGADPGSTLFLDDSVENVLAAREFGMHAVQFIQTHQALETMREILEKEG